MILVAGGTGRLGGLVVARLQARGLDVRVVTRDLDRAHQLRDRGVEVVRGDVRDRASIERAMDGATVAVSAVQGFAGSGRVTPASVDRDGNATLVDAAVAAGADVVMMSVVGASADNRMDLFRAKYAAEQHLRASGPKWTIVRATAFIELWAEILHKAPVFGVGDNPINFVAVADVAAVVDRAVVDTSLRGKTLEVGGPQDLTFNDMAALLHELRGQPAKTRHIPRPVLQIMAPISRKARAAVAMDTNDMTFAAGAARADFADLPFTDLRAALADTVGQPAA